MWRVKNLVFPKFSSSELVTTGSADSHLPLSVLHPAEVFPIYSIAGASVRGGFHLRSGSCRSDHLADSPGDQFGVVKMNPVSAVARHQMSPTRRELR